MNTAEYIRQSVTMSDICARYNFTPNRAGFISCPFHDEKTASLKIYPDKKGFHCFGCGAGGSVIDFVARYFGVGFFEAIKMLNRDFVLELSISKNSSYREREIFRKKVREAEERRIKEAEECAKRKEEYDRLLDEYVKCDKIIRFFKPSGPEEPIDDLYAWAMHKMPVIEFRLDCMGGENFGG